jgi:hypothetical protein
MLRQMCIKRELYRITISEKILTRLLGWTVCVPFPVGQDFSLWGPRYIIAHGKRDSFQGLAWPEREPNKKHVVTRLSLVSMVLS